MVIYPADTEINSNGAPVFLLASSSFKERKREALLVSFDGTLMNKPLQSTKIGNIGFSANKIEANKKRKLNLSFVPESIAKNNTLPCCAEVVGMIEELKSATATLEIQPQLIYFGAKKSINKQYSDEFIYDCDMYGAAEEICDQQGLENTSSTIVNISGLKHPNYKFKNVTDIVKIDDTQIKLGTGTRESTFIQNLGSEIWTAFSPFPSLPR